MNKDLLVKKILAKLTKDEKDYLGEYKGEDLKAIAKILDFISGNISKVVLEDSAATEVKLFAKFFFKLEAPGVSVNNGKLFFINFNGKYVEFAVNSEEFNKIKKYLDSKDS